MEGSIEVRISLANPENVRAVVNVHQITTREDIDWLINRLRAVKRLLPKPITLGVTHDRKDAVHLVGSSQLEDQVYKV